MTDLSQLSFGALVPAGGASTVDVPMDPRAALEQVFGFDDFRPGQREAVEAACAGRDVLVVMPTGAGKSLCYQLPALMRDDLTIVVSPLVSLMQDQVEGLERVAPGVGRARQRAARRGREPGHGRARDPRRAPHPLHRARALLVAGVPRADPRRADRAVRRRRGALRLAVGPRLPARLLPPRRRRALARRAGDRRVDRDRDAAGRGRHRDAAGAAGPGEGLDGLRPAEPLVRRRAEQVQGRQGAAADHRAAARRARCRRSSTRGRGRGRPSWPSGSGSALGREVLAYHAGLARDARAEAQRRFMSGEVDVVVATNAFGMGVDKADVRTVAHESVPGSVEAYYQEAGRAGRDGAPARCLLFAEGRDKGLHVFFIQRGELGDDVIAKVARRLLRDVRRRPLRPRARRPHRDRRRRRPGARDPRHPRAGRA